MLKRSSVNSFLTVKVDKCGKNKHDAISRKLSKAQEKVRGMLKAEFWTTIQNVTLALFTPKRHTLHKTGLLRRPLELGKYANITAHETLNKFGECLKLNSWNGFFVSALWSLAFNNSKQFKTWHNQLYLRWRLTRYAKQDFSKRLL